MTEDYEFRLRPGRIRSKGGERVRPFIQQALAAAHRAGGTVSRQGRIGPGNRSRLGVGQRASVVANRFITNRSRGAVVKARVVRNIGTGGKLGAHLAYLRREGVTRDGERAQTFGSDGNHVDAAAFAERCEDDRHHFRFIVSPDDALEIADLRSFTRDLMNQAERDLGSKLDWVAVDHWNTEHPHIHVIVRGVRDDGENLVIARDYIREGMRDRARDLITQELGLRTDQEIRRTLSIQIDAERFTNLDRQLVRDAARHGIVDMAPALGATPDEFHVEKLGRLRKLQSLGLAEQLAPGQWALSETSELTLRELGERGDIIKRIHRGLAASGIERSTASYVLAGESIDSPVIGRLIERGLDDELKGSAYAVVDGTDGRTHHIRLANLDAAGDSAPGSIVELRAFDDANGMRRVALAVRSDLSIETQVTANGATWLDRQAIAGVPVALGSGGFGADVQTAMDRRAEHLIGQGLAERRGQGVSFARNLIEKLKQRELDAISETLAAQTGRTFSKATTGEYVSGTYRQRLTLASGRFAMIDDGLGFQLVPWTPSIEKQLGRHVSGIARGDGGVDWSFGRKRGLGM